jgi:polyvinyl alcohol dehydrogenase (cytochrome)
VKFSLRNTTTLLAGLGIAALVASHGQAQQPQPRANGEALYNKNCATCHDHPEDRTPPKATLTQVGPDVVVDALTNGIMKPMAASLTKSDISDLAYYLTGKMPSGPKDDPALANMCPKADPIDMSKGNWNGWSPDASNNRYQANSGLKATDIPKLKVKWTFAYGGSKNSQVTVVGNRLFLGSTAGLMYSLNAKTGCTYWRYEPAAGMRAAPVVIKLSAAPSGYAVIVNDNDVHVNALDAVSGKVLWATKVEDHPRGVLTGANKIYNGVIYVPVSSLEEVSITAPGYVCCSFRGSVVALDVATGKQLWKTYTISEPAHTYRPGKPQMGPAGAAIWASPTIDPKRGVLYVTTGDSYTDVDTNGADAVVAMDLKTGAIKWNAQMTEKDNFVVGCPRTGPVPGNCPTPLGPDVDFGSAPILIKMKNGKDMLVAGQKSSEVYGIDPDTKGNVVWKIKLGRGGASGGVEWGMAADQDKVYVALADAGAGGNPSLNALDVATGKVVWKVPAPVVPCQPPRRCIQSQSAPVTALPGVVLSGAMDGHMRAYDAKTGAIVWDFDTAAEAYDTVNGIKGAKGGTLDATGPTFANGMMFQHSGYPGVMAVASSGQNLLMAFTVDGK